MLKLILIFTLLTTSIAYGSNGDMEQIFFEAAKSGDIKKVKLLLKKNVDINAINSSDYPDYTALISASKNGHIDIVKLLIDNGADLDIGDAHTALTRVAIAGRVKIVKLLIDSGVKE